MTGREVPVKILTTDQGELNKEAQLRREKDALWFIENPNKQTFHRLYVPGETYPYELPVASTVIVHPHTWEFIAHGKSTLVIEKPRVEKKKKKKTHINLSMREIQARRTANRNNHDKHSTNTLEST